MKVYGPSLAILAALLLLLPKPAHGQDDVLPVVPYPQKDEPQAGRGNRPTNRQLFPVFTQYRILCACTRPTHNLASGRQDIVLARCSTGYEGVPEWRGPTIGSTIYESYGARV